MIPQYPSSIRWWNPPVILFFSWVEMHEIMRCKFSGARPESYKSTVEVALGHSWSVFSCALLCIFLRFGVDFCTTFWLLSRTKTVCHSGQNFHFFPKNYEEFLLSKSSKIWFKCTFVHFPPFGGGFLHYFLIAECISLWAKFSFFLKKNMRHFYLLNHQKFDSNIFMIHFFLCIFEHFHSLRGGTSTLSVLENQKNEMFSLGLFEYGKVKGGRLVNEADFEAKTKIFQQKNLAFQLCFYVLWHFSH